MIGDMFFCPKHPTTAMKPRPYGFAHYCPDCLIELPPKTAADDESVMREILAREESNTWLDSGRSGVENNRLITVGTALQAMRLYAAHVRAQQKEEDARIADEHGADIVAAAIRQGEQTS